MKVKIERLGINGEGVGKITAGENDGKVVFVKNALPDELVEIGIIKNNKNFCIGQLKDVCEGSTHRVNPECKYFGKCGGCQLQHLNYEKQRQYKIDSVTSTIRKIAKLDIEISDILYDKIFAYRNKMVFPVGQGKNGAFLGMFEGESHNVIKIDKCLLAKEGINILLNVIDEYIKNNFTGYSFKEEKGDIKYVVIRQISDSYLVTIVASKKAKLPGLYEVLCKHVKNVGISLIISDSSEEILSGKYYHINGIQSITFNEFGIDYSIDNRGFLQVNDNIKKLLYNKVLDNINKEDKVLDGYAGAGLLSAIISKKCKKVIGIEINSSACASAKNLIKSNNLHNIDYYEGDIKNYIDDCIDKNVNVVVLDPPRSGCEKEVLDKIICVDRIERIIYISCNPATLARDLNVLKDNFKVNDITLFEMFPQTKHVETLVVLERIENNL